MKEKDICGIYYIKNKINGKLYIGQSVTIYYEWTNQHRYKLRNNKHFNKYLQRSWNKYGEENFEHGIIAECKVDQLDCLEIYYIKFFHSHMTENGYNISWGGSSPMRGINHTDEAKQKISETSKGENNGFYGKKHTEETRKKMKGPMSEEAKQHMRKPKSEEHKSHLRKPHPSMSGKNHPSFGKKRKNAVSQYFGVGYEKGKRSLKHWTAFAEENGRSKRIGRYLTEIEAAIEHDKYLIKTNSVFPLNFPELFFNEGEYKNGK